MPPTAYRAGRRGSDGHVPYDSQPLICALSALEDSLGSGEHHVHLGDLLQSRLSPINVGDLQLLQISDTKASVPAIKASQSVVDRLQLHGMLCGEFPVDRDEQLRGTGQAFR